MEGNPLDVAMPVAKDPRIAARRGFVARCGRPVAVDAENLPPEALQVLGQRSVMVVAGGDVEEPVGWTEADAAAAMRSRSAPAIEAVFERNIGHDVSAVAHF